MICFRLKVETLIIPFRLIPLFLCFNLVQSPIMSFSQPFQKSKDTELMCYRLIAGVIELTGDEFCPIAELIIEVDQEIERVGWSKEQGMEYLLHNFQKRSRTLMSREELDQFLTYLRKLRDT